MHSQIKYPEYEKAQSNHPPKRKGQGVPRDHNTFTPPSREYVFFFRPRNPLESPELDGLSNHLTGIFGGSNGVAASGRPVLERERRRVGVAGVNATRCLSSGGTLSGNSFKL